VIGEAGSHDLARPEGLEPPAYWFEANRSIQLSYGRGSGDRDLMVSPRYFVAPRRFFGVADPRKRFTPAQ
jgi:hypothetical protein